MTACTFRYPEGECSKEVRHSDAANFPYGTAFLDVIRC